MLKNIKRLSVICLFVLLCLPGCTKDGHVANKVSVWGLDVGGMSCEEAAEALKSLELSETDAVTFNIDGEAISITAGEVSAAFNAEKTAEFLVENSGGFLSGWLKKSYPMQVDIDAAVLDEILKKSETEMKTISGCVTDEGLKITNGVKGRVIDREKAKEALAAQLGSDEKEEVVLEFIITEPDKTDYKEFLEGFLGEFKEPEYIRDEDGIISVTESSPGVSFDVQEALKIMNEHMEEGEVFVIPCSITLPEFTKPELEAMLFRDNMGSYTTSFATSSANRSSNIALATKALDGMVLMPGDEFSFNKTVGERTVDRGYKTAGAYVAGKTVDQVGGGICQVSSTLYNTVLLSNLEIVERRNHQMTVSYVPVGRDATVNWGTTDFRFKNNTKYPVKLAGTVSGKKVTISMVGTLEDPDQNVKIETNTVSVLTPGEEIIEDPEKEVGFTETDKGSNGYIVEATRVVYSGDTVVKREALTKSRYNPTNNVTTIGTKVVEAPTDVSAAEEEMPSWLMPPTEQADGAGL